MGPVSIFILVLLCVYLVQNKFKLLRIGYRIPGPSFIPLIGNVQLMSQLRPEALFLMVEKLRQTYRSTFRIWLGSQLWVFLHSSEETRQALNEPSLVRADIFQLLSTLIGNGLLISEGKHWHNHRRALGPAFHPNILERFTERICHHAEIFVERLLTKKEGVDVMDFIFPCMLDTICDTSMGKNLRTQEDEASPYTRVFHEASQLLFKRMVNPLLSSDFIYHRTKSYKRLRNAVSIIHDMTDEVIRDQSNCLKLQDNQTTGKYNRTLLQILLTTEIDRKPLSFQDIKDEVNTFLFAGVDTTTAAMGFVLYCLAKYSICQEKLFNEISAAHADDDLNLNKMQYLDMFIKECLRFYTVVPLTGRQVTQDIQIGSFDLCQGTTLWINMYGLAHDEKYFPQPNLFNPERFGIDEPEIPAFAYIPFSGGPHSCIGRKYAMLILKILTVKTLMKARVQLKNPDEELVLMAEMVLRSKSGINLLFLSRD